jgi:hypothetical protein
LNCLAAAKIRSCVAFGMDFAAGTPFNTREIAAADSPRCADKVAKEAGDPAFWAFATLSGFTTSNFREVTDLSLTHFHNLSFSFQTALDRPQRIGS